MSPILFNVLVLLLFLRFVLSLLRMHARLHISNYQADDDYTRLQNLIFTVSDYLGFLLALLCFKRFI